MSKRTMFFFVGVAVVVAATAILAAFIWVVTAEQPGPSTSTGAPRISADSGVSVTNTAELCGVTVVWNYLSQQVTFVNRNDEDMQVEYNDFMRFPGPWGDKLPGRGGSATVRQTNIVGQKVQIRVRDTGEGKQRCDISAKVLLGQ